MKTGPSHGKAGRPGSRAADAARRTGFTTGAAFAMIRKELQERRARTAAISDEQLNDLAAQIAALRESLEPGRDSEAFLREVRVLLADNLVTLKQQVVAAATTAVSGPAEMIRRDVASLKEIQASVDRKTQDTFEAVYGTIERIADRLAAIEGEMRDRGGSAGDAATPAPAAAAQAGPEAAEDLERYLLPSVRPAPDPARRTSDRTGTAKAGTAKAATSKGATSKPGTAGAGIAAARSDSARSDAGPRMAAREPVRPEVAELEAVRSKIAELEAAAAARAGAGTVRETTPAGREPAGPRLAAPAGPIAADDDETAGDEPVAGVAKAGAGTGLQRAVLRRPAAFPRGGFAGKAGFAARRKGVAMPWWLRPSRKSVAFAVGGALLVALGGAAAIAIDRYLASARSDVGDAGDGGDDAAAAAAATTVGQGEREPPPPEDGAGARGPEDPAGAEATEPGTAASRPAAGAATAVAASVATDAGVPADGSVRMMRNALLPAAAPGRDPWPAEPADPVPAVPPAIASKALVAAAQAGDAGAYYEIGVRLAQGRGGVGQDYARAAVFLERAARAGVVPAQFRLGVLYEKGLGVRKDPGEARRLYAAAAAKGHARAMHGLAEVLEHGVNGPPDHAGALEWFRKAAASGVADSQYALGIAYARGSGVERDPVEAFTWLALAARGGNREAVRERDEVAAGLAGDDLEAAHAGVEAFTATPQPDQATATRAPAGGWDPPAVAATTKSRPAARTERFPQR